MKVRKLVTVEQEVEIEVYAKDIAAEFAALADPGDMPHTMLAAVAGVLKAIPDAWIVALSPANRAVVADFLNGQSGRYRAVSAANESDETEGRGGREAAEAAGAGATDERI